MISAARLRLLTFAANLALLAGVVIVGVEAFRAHPARGVPTRFDAVALALEDTATATQDLSAVWDALDRPEPPPHLDPQTPPEPSRAEGWRLLLAILDPERPDKGASVVEAPGGAQFSLTVGGTPVEGMTLERVEVSDAEGGRETVATLRGPDQRAHRLRLQRK